jgi:hypothetical protein
MRLLITKLISSRSQQGILGTEPFRDPVRNPATPDAIAITVTIAIDIPFTIL